MRLAKNLRVAKKILEHAIPNMLALICIKMTATNKTRYSGCQSRPPERAKVNEETRRLTDLFSEALPLPAIAEAADSIDCPLCSTEDSLTPERVVFFRARVADTEALKAA